MKARIRPDLAIRILFVFTFVAATCMAARAQGVPPPCVPNPAAENAVMEWNCRTIKYALSPTFGGALRQIRAMAVVQLAVHNAVNSITREYETYHRNTANVPPTGASADAAAIGAAYQALYGILTSAQRVQLDIELAASLSARSIPDNDASLVYGKAEGQNIVNLRTGDGSGPEAQCAYSDIVDPQPGQWRRILNVETNTTPLAATPCWVNVPTFVLRSADQFPLDAPPSLASETYLEDFLEVKNYGGQNADTLRQVWQTRIADFWDGAPIAIVNQVIRQAAAAQNAGLSANARALAVVYVAGTDASIACWHYKYSNLFWRPETAVNLSEPIPSPYWKPYIFPSHPHPEYPSGHSTNSGAMLNAAALVFGDKPGVTLTPTIIRNGTPVTPNWESFSEGIDEVVSARVYSGLHFRFTDEASVNLARRISHFVYVQAFRACTRGNCK